MSEGETGSGFVEAAMRDGAVERRDDRGLMPLAEARALVRAASEFRKGSGRMIGPSWVLDSDRLWAALMSLEDAAELVREGTRIRWFFHPRGQDNIAPIERYGEAILPWLASFVRPDGRFVEVPWCVRSCLMQIGRAEVFDLLWRVTCVADGIGDGWPGPFAVDDVGDADRRSGTRFDEPGLTAPDNDAHGLVMEWVCAHPTVGFPRLAGIAEAGDARARLMLKSLAQSGPQQTFAYVCHALGEGHARAIFTAAGAPTELDEGCILITLSAGADAGWPELFAGAPERAYHAMRLVAARAKAGDGWGVAFERIEGDTLESAVVRPYLYGSNVGSGPRDVDEGLPLLVDGERGASVSPFDLDGLRIRGPEGPLDLTSAMIAERDLRPGRVTAEGVASSWASLIVRAYLTAHPDAFWADPRALVRTLGLEDDAEVLVVTSAFEHSVGLAGPEVYPAAWRLPPSRSPVFRSLARALVARDASIFEPGEPNLDFRLHALATTEQAREDA